MKRISIAAWLTALGVLLLAARSGAQEKKPVLAVMPAGYFAADAQSAENLTDAFRKLMEEKGYALVAPEPGAEAFKAMALSQNRHLSDTIARDFGRRLGADVVLYPRLLALGKPAIPAEGQDRSRRPAAVVLVRFVNVHTGRTLYVQQVSHEYDAPLPPPDTMFTLPRDIAAAAAAEAMELYWQRRTG